MTRRLFLCCFTVFFLLSTALTADEVKSGCEYQPIDVDRYGGERLRRPPEVRSHNGELDTRLTIDYGRQPIAGCETRLRLYDQRLIGPTLEAKPGDTLNVDIVNRLPPGSMPSTAVNTPHGFNRTNLHTHGLHVSPVGNADNVLLEIAPGRSFRSEIKIPRDHPPGTFWYHPHVHGATAIQVGSGMAGALIIRGGIDNLPQIERMAEQIFVFQQIPYDLKGEVEDFAESFGRRKWAASHRQTTINGQIFPTIHMRPGEIQRWRLIHAGVRESLRLVLDGHRLNEIAVDGLVTGHIDSWNKLVLEPGYRSDVLVQAASVPRDQLPAEFILYDDETPASDALLAEPERRQALAKIIIEGPPVDMPMPSEAALKRFVPHDPIERIDGRQEVEFNIDTSTSPPKFTVNGREFNPDHRRVLELGRAEEWTLSTLRANHPFHIHVNPFEYERIGADGNPQRIFRDTLLVRRGEPRKIRTRYSRYIGTFVLHCHILDHEDQGMMELVEVRLPGSGPDGMHVHELEPMAAAVADEAPEDTEKANLRVRKSIDELEEEELANYLHAVRQLKQISAESRRSKDGYDYFARLHNSGPPFGPCEHGRDSFLPWHRAHLIEFEDALRRSDPPRTSNVTVPYWDWSKVPTGNRFPEIFEDRNSVLFHRGRESTAICKDGAPPDCQELPFPWKELDKTAAGALAWKGTGPYNYGGESDEAEKCMDRNGRAYGALELPAHNTMHTGYVGGKLMDPSTAAEDPIFWSFHAFIDLLWDDWQQREDREVDSCLDCQLCGLFKDPEAGTEPWAVNDTKSTVAMGYRYKFEPGEDPADAALAAPTPEAVPFASHPAVDFATTGRRSPELVRTEEIVVPTRLDQAVSLRLSDVPRPADINYEGNIYLYPATETFRPLERDFRKSYLIDLYSIWMGHGEHERPATDIVIDLTDELDALSVQHAGEVWLLTIAVAPSGEDERPAGLAESRQSLSGVLDFGKARVQGLSKD